MHNRTHLKNGFGQAASHYDEHAELQALIRADAMALAIEHWPKNASILDLGCGTGAFAREAQLQGLSLKITGADIALGMCIQAHKTTPRVVNASADALPFKDESFDGVFSSLMLQWADNTLATLREIARVCKPGGRAILTSFTHGTLGELAETFATLDTAPHINSFLEPMQLSAQAAHAGLALLHAEEETFTEYYSDAASLMRNMKAIGASSKREDRPKGLMTPKRLKTLEARYKEHFGKAEGLPATWNAMTLLLEKP